MRMMRQTLSCLRKEKQSEENGVIFQDCSSSNKSIRVLGFIVHYS